LNFYESTISGLNNSNYTNIAYIEGSGLNSKIKLVIGGTTSNVVVAVTAEIIVNHAGDIYIKSESGAYTQITIKIISDGNENFYIQAKTTSSNLLNAKVGISTYSGEIVTF
jgi:hypothetical protein